MASLADCYSRGRGTPQNRQKAFELYSKLAEHGNALGYAGLGTMYMRGEYVSKDEKKAFEMYQKAADLKDRDLLSANVYYELGCYYLLGEVTTANYSKASEYFKEAAALRSPLGWFGLSVLAWFGLGEKENHDLGNAYFEKSGLSSELTGRWLQQINDKLFYAKQKDKNK